MMTLSSGQALACYHAAYDNEAYGTVTDELAWALGADNVLSAEALRRTPDYIALSNLVTNVALEICGHPAYHGAGWQLATSVLAVTEPKRRAGVLDDAASRQLFQRIDGYLGIYRAHMREFHATAAHSAEVRLATAQATAEDAVRAANAAPNWPGRAAYHLSTASAGLLRVASILLENGPRPAASSLRYAGEKFARAMQDLRYALTEITQHTTLPGIFHTLHETLRETSHE